MESIIMTKNKNWSTKKLGEISTIRMGETLIKKDLTGEGVPVYSADSLEKPWGFTSKNKLEFLRGSIIVGARGTLGSVKLPDDTLFTSTQTTIILSPQQKTVSPAFLFYYLRKVDFKKLRGGSGIPMLTVTRLNDLEIPLPPLPEQKKIVYVLDSIQDAIRAQEKIIEKTKELKKSMMADLFKYGGPSFRKGRKLKKTEIGEIPENWEVVEADKFCTSVTDGTHETPKKSEEGYYLITSKNLKEGKLDFKDAYKIDQKDFDKVNKRSKVNQYDVLFGMIGTIGSPILITEKNPQFAIKNVGLFKNSGDYIKGNYLSYYLDSGYAQYFVQKNTTRTAQSYLTLGLLRKFPILKPPITETKEVIKILQTIDQKIEIEQKKKALYEELFKTMLNKLMSGEIDVEKIKI